MSESVCAHVDDWSLEHFGGTHFGDRRLSKRVLKIADAMAKAPEESFPKRHVIWPDLKAAYNFLNHPHVTPDKIQATHRKLVREECQAHEYVLVVQDGSELDYTHHPATQGLGFRGDGRGRGLLQHSALALTPEGAVLGVLYQTWWRRQRCPEGETRRQRQARPTEAGLWETTIEAVGTIGEQTRVIHVMDRGGDSFQTMDAAWRTGVGYLLRAQHDRYLGDGTQRLWSSVQRERIAGYREVQVASQPGKKGSPRTPARTARLAIRFAEVEIRPPTNDPRMAKRPPLRVWAVHALEQDPPMQAEPIEWMLLTSEPIQDFESANRCVQSYTYRWVIEEWHKVEKTGCRLEASQLKTAEALECFAALVAVVAVRLLQLRDVARADCKSEHLCDATPASERSGTTRLPVPQDWLLVVAYLAKREPEEITPALFWLTIAKQGGFIGRRSDGWPGWQTIWKGWLKIQTLVQGMAILRSQQEGKTYG